MAKQSSSGRCPNGMRSTVVGIILTTLLAVGGCGPNDSDEYNAAQQAGTVEALEDFVAKHPNSRLLEVATNRLEEVRFKKAREANSIEGWKEYIGKQKDGPNISTAKYELERLAFKDAEKDKSGAKLHKFLEDYPGGTFASAARTKIKALEEAAAAEAESEEGGEEPK